MDDKDQYVEICKERFDSLDGKLKDIKEILVGDGRQPGLADDVRELKAFKKTTVGTLLLIIGTVVTQVAIWIRSHL